MEPQKKHLIWESEVTRTGDNQVTLRACKPLSGMPVAAAAKILGVSKWTVQKLWRMGLLKGSKPGAAKVRSDGHGSNAALVLDAESVLAYKARQEEQAKQEQQKGCW